MKTKQREIIMTEQYDDRLSTLESDLRHVTGSVESLARSVNSLVIEIRSEVKEIREGGEITWPLILSAIGTIVSVTIIVGALFYQGIQPLYLAIDNSQLNNELARTVVRSEAQLDTNLITAKFDITKEEYEKDILNLEKDLEDFKEKLFSHMVLSNGFNASQDEKIEALKRELEISLDKK